MLVGRVKEKNWEDVVLQVYLKQGEVGQLEKKRGEVGSWWGRRILGGIEYGGGKA